MNTAADISKDMNPDRNTHHPCSDVVCQRIHLHEFFT